MWPAHRYPNIIHSRPVIPIEILYHHGDDHETCDYGCIRSSQHRQVKGSGKSVGFQEGFYPLVLASFLPQSLGKQHRQDRRKHSTAYKTHPENFCTHYVIRPSPNLQTSCYVRTTLFLLPQLSHSLSNRVQLCLQDPYPLL